MMHHSRFPGSSLHSARQRPPRLSAALATAGIALLLSVGCQGPEEPIHELERGAAPGLASDPHHASAADSQTPAANGLRHAITRLRQTEAGERYRLRWSGGAVLGDNPAHNFGARFGTDGVQVENKDKTWQVGLHLARWGFRGALHVVGSGAVKAERNRISNTRRHGLEEWYLNGPGGLEQGFNIARRPEAAGAEGEAGPLVLELNISGNVEPRLSDQGRSITFHDLRGRAVAVYRDLWVEDARGKLLDARLGLEQGRVLIEVDEAGAAYPLVVDPMLMGVESKVLATDGSSLDYFGYTVSLDGSTALIGAYGDDDKGNMSGSVYVFMRDNSRWLQHQKLTASDGAAADYFGYAVSLKGNTAVVGAYGNDDKGSTTGSAYIFARSGTTWKQQQKILGADSAAGDYFGYAVSAHGDTVLVGAYFDDDRGSNSGSAYVFARSGSTWTQQQKLTAGNGGGDDRFGFSVAVEGDVALVGAYYEDTRGTNAGSAYVFARSGSTWKQQQMLTATNAGSYDYFGYAVSMGGNTALVGAHQEDTRGSNAGAAYVFTSSGSAWKQQKMLVAADGQGGDYFGYSVSMGLDQALVGALYEDARAGNAGAAYVYYRSGSTWTQQRKLTAHDGANSDYYGIAVAISGDTALSGADLDDDKGTNSGSVYFHRLCLTPDEKKITASDGYYSDYFGAAVSVHGDTALVGAQYDDDKGTNSGSAYVFARIGNAWGQQQKLVASDGAAHDYFGYAVSVHGDTALVGAYYDDPKSTNSGSAYVFARTGSTWSQQMKLVPSDGAYYDYFGYAVSVHGNTALVGAYLDDDKGTNSGSAYVFARTGTNWSQQRKLTADDGYYSDYFGYAVSINDNTALVGALYDDDRGGSSGSAYVYTRTGVSWSVQTKLTANDGGSSDNFGAAVSVSGDMALVGSYLDDDRGGNAGAAYIFSRSGSLWNQQKKLTAQDGRGNDYFGRAVSLSGDVALVGAYLDDDKGTNSGSAYLYRRAGTNWYQHQKYVAATGSSNDYFGWAVAVHGEVPLIGAYGDNDLGADSGTAFVFSTVCKNQTGKKCTSSNDCTSGICVDGVCCNKPCGGGAATDCQACSVKAGAAQDGICGPVKAGFTCRPGNGGCDVAETCDGKGTACPKDVVQSASHTCRASAGDCDLPENCSGTTKQCPKDTFRAGTFTCRMANGVCDEPETCSGSSAACPKDGVRPSSFPCRGAVGMCDRVENCDGTTKGCPPNVLEKMGKICNPANGGCDVAETCSGSSAFCPTDLVQNSGHPCRASAGICDVVETCNGSTKICPVDLYKAKGISCRGSAGICDAAETCIGISPFCPGDLYHPNTVSCRPSAGECDLTENCTGVKTKCPKDLFKADGTPCSLGYGKCLNGKCIMTPPDAGPADAGPDAMGDGSPAADMGPDAPAAPDTGVDTSPGFDHGADSNPTAEAGADAKAGDLASGDGTKPGDAPGGDSQVPPGTEDGCSCRVGGEPLPAPWLSMLALFLLVRLGRRRRSSR